MKDDIACFLLGWLFATLLWFGVFRVCSVDGAEPPTHWQAARQGLNEHDRPGSVTNPLEGRDAGGRRWTLTESLRAVEPAVAPPGSPVNPYRLTPPRD